MGANTNVSRVKRGETKYPAIGIFAAAIGMSRAGAWKALEANDPVMWDKYADFRKRMEAAQDSAVQAAKARVSNAKPVRFSRLAEAENLRLHDEYLRDAYQERMGDYFNS